VPPNVLRGCYKGYLVRPVVLCHHCYSPFAWCTPAAVPSRHGLRRSAHQPNE
jgi:hypothetical protein